MKVSIMGAGAFGTALGKILVDNGHLVSYYDPRKLVVSLEGATAEAEVVVIAIPSEVMQSFCAAYPDHLKSLPTILATKGLTGPKLFDDFKDFVVLSGPAFAEDLNMGKEATLTATSELPKKLFENGQITIELTNDLHGVMLCGSLKNVYAIGAGYGWVEMGLGKYIEQAHSEMRRYLADHGANPETVELACGIGDLTLTCSGPQSRNFQCGQLLRIGLSLEEIGRKLGTVEGITTLGEIDRESYPMITKIYGLTKE